MKRRTHRKINNVINNFVFALLMVAMLIGGVYTTAAVIVITQMDTPTPTWDTVQHVARTIGEAK